VYVSGLRKKRGFLDWILANSSRKSVAKTKGKYLMLVPEITEGFGAQRSLDERQVVSTHILSLPGE
jgi:hypothetical protein